MKDSHAACRCLNGDLGKKHTFVNGDLR